MNASEIQSRAKFERIRYAQCWEDSQLLTKALKPEGRHCLSIGSAGDNSFALLADGAASVTAVELNPTQVACIDLRKAAYQCLDHQAFLELIGSRPSTQRTNHYQICRERLMDSSRTFWDANPSAIRPGIGSAGKFERYFTVFRSFVLRLAHPKPRIQSLLRKRSYEERRSFYEQTWNNRRWNWIFQTFFSRSVMGVLGRDPEFFKYVEGSVAGRILTRTRHALVELDPSENPYLHWILTGTHGESLPEALTEVNFPKIRAALHEDRFHIVTSPLEELLTTTDARKFDAFNLSDIFEYMSGPNTEALLRRIHASANPGARLAYWNMLAPRSRPQSMAAMLRSHSEEAERLFTTDRAFFYSRFVVEEVIR